MHSARALLFRRHHERRAASFREDVGELLAIREFNDRATRSHRIRLIHGRKRNPLLEPEWAEVMWAYHRFDHSRNNECIGRRHDSRFTDPK
jgi:hypothetical protein